MARRSDDERAYRIATPDERRAAPVVVGGHVGGGAVQPRTNPDVEAFVKGLGSLNANLQSSFDEERREQLAAGRNAARSGATKEDVRDKPRSFMEGYLNGSGEAAAIKDAEEMQGAAAGMGADEADKFIQEFYAKKMKGAPDDEFRRGYDRVFGEQAQYLRKKLGEQTAAEIVTTNQANAGARIGYAIERAKSAGNGLTPDLHNEINAIASEMRIRPQDKDEMIFIALKKYSDRGDASVWEWTKAPRKDAKTGADFPALYDNPKWKEKIDAAQLHAENTFLSKQQREREIAKSERQERQGKALQPVAQMILRGDTDGAEIELKRLQQDSALFPDAGELLNWSRAFRTEIAATEKPGEQAAFTVHLQKIYTGGLGLQDIPKLTDVGATTKRQLLSEWYRVDGERRRRANEQRLTEAQVRNLERQAFTDPIFENANRVLSTALQPVPDPLNDPFGKGKEVDNQELALAQQQLYHWRYQNPQAGPDAIAQYADQLRTGVLQRRAERAKQGAGATDGSAATFVPFGSLRELEEAVERGKVAPSMYLIFQPILAARARAKVMGSQPTTK